MAVQEVFTVQEVAKLLKVSEEVVEQEIQSSRLKAIKVGDELRIPENSINAFFDQPQPELQAKLQTLGFLSGLKDGDEFDYHWPLGEEHYTNVKTGEWKEEGAESVNVQIGECIREAFGRDRKRIIVFFDEYPNAEFVEIDKPGYVCTLLPGNPKPKGHLWEGDPILPEWNQFTIRKQSELIKAPRATDGLVIVVKEDDFEAMVRFSRLKAFRRYRW